ncbi:hypothetical protein pb186bvf_011660 [Paramecium bursaria]
MSNTSFYHFLLQIPNTIFINFYYTYQCQGSQLYSSKVERRILMKIERKNRIDTIINFKAENLLLFCFNQHVVTQLYQTSHLIQILPPQATHGLNYLLNTWKCIKEQLENKIYKDYNEHPYKKQLLYNDVLE